ncbi:hypothetical protein BKA81DRAFT_368941 [Phyllosticta paracitricarpa]
MISVLSQDHFHIQHAALDCSVKRLCRRATVTPCQTDPLVHDGRALVGPASWADVFLDQLLRTNDKYSEATVLQFVHSIILTLQRRSTAFRCLIFALWRRGSRLQSRRAPWFSVYVNPIGRKEDAISQNAGKSQHESAKKSRRKSLKRVSRGEGLACDWTSTMWAA